MVVKRKTKKTRVKTAKVRPAARTKKKAGAKRKTKVAAKKKAVAKRKKKAASKRKDKIVDKAKQSGLSAVPDNFPPSKTLPESDHDKVKHMAELGMTLEQMAYIMDMSEKTLKRRMVDDETLKTSYKRGKAEGVLFVTGQLMGLIIIGNVAAIIFYLKTQCGWRERIDVGGKVVHEHVDTFAGAVETAPTYIRDIIERLPLKAKRDLETLYDEDGISKIQ